MLTDRPFVFVSDRGGPISADTVARIVSEATEVAGIGFHAPTPISCGTAPGTCWPVRGRYPSHSGFSGPSRYQEHLRYTKLSPHRLASVWVR